MKQILITLTCVCMIYTATAQNTTWVEYNYMNDGIRDYFERGVDLKKGYRLSDIYEYGSNPNSEFEKSFYTLRRLSDSSYAGLIFVFKNIKTSAITTYAIPSYDNIGDYTEPNKMVTTTFDKVNKSPSEIKNYFNWYLVQYMGVLQGIMNTQQKNKKKPQ